MKFLIELFGLSPEDYNEWEFRWFAQDSGWIPVVLAILVPLALWFFWQSLNRISSAPKKVFLFGLRLVSVVLLLLVLSHPELEFRKSNVMRNAVAVLFDDSNSMSIKTAGRQRIDFVRDLLRQKHEYFEALKADYQLDYYYVSDKLTPVSAEESGLNYQSRGTNTDFGRILEAVKKQYEGKSLAGAMLFSDGADLSQEPPEIAQEMKDALARFKAPIHTFQAGTNEDFRDLGIEYIESPEFGFIQQPYNLVATVTASAVRERRIPLILKKDGKILASQMIEIKAGQTRYRVDMQFTPNSLGLQTYSLYLPLLADESIDVNNSRDFQINVVRDRVRILHLTGRPSWDSRYLREVLISNPKVDLLSFFILRTLSDEVEATTGELSLIPFPSNLLFTDYLNSFDIIIFQNFQYTPFVDKKYLPNIKNYVENGGAFIMIGGDLAFGGGGYANTPIEEILPVNLMKESVASIEDEFHFQESKDYLNHPILRLEKDDEANRNAWKSMPTLNGLNTGLIPKKNAHVLASFARGKGQSAYPVLVVGGTGKGRSMVFSTDTSWNWNFRKVGKGGSGRYYQKFWNNVIAWMIGDQETNPIQIVTDKEKYRVDEKVLIKFKVLNERFSPVVNKKVRLSVHSKVRKKEVLNQTVETDMNGEGGFQYLPDAEGFYAAKLEKEFDKESHSNSTSFGVFSDMAEYQRPMINAALLETMATATGGVYQVLNGSTDMNLLRFPNPKVYVKASGKVITLWDNWWSYGLILFFLFCDWYLRRKAGLS